MLRRFLRPTEAPPPQEPPRPSDDELPLFHRCLREIHQAHLDTQEGTLCREAYLSRKLTLLRSAVRDAQAQDQAERLLELMQTLRLTCAVNDVEVESIKRHLAN